MEQLPQPLTEINNIDNFKQQLEHYLRISPTPCMIICIVYSFSGFTQ